MHIQTHKYVHSHTYKQIHMHTYKHIQTHTNTYTHTLESKANEKAQLSDALTTVAGA